MKILFVSHCYPWSLENGTTQRVYHLVRTLVTRHRVTFVSLRRPGMSGEFALSSRCERVIEVDARSCVAYKTDRYCNWASAPVRAANLINSPFPNVTRRWRSEELLGVLRKLRASEEFDLAWAERSFIGEQLKRAGFQKIVVDVDDLESVVLDRTLREGPWYRSKPLDHAELVKLRMYERSLCQRFWRVVVCKEEDRAFFGKSGPKVFVVPNGAEDHAPANPENERAGEFLFVGGMSFEPNVDAVERFTGTILPRIRNSFPTARLNIVGRDTVARVQALHDGDSCIVHGRVPDTSPHYETASVVVAPIRLGAGSRLKIPEALARGKAVVASSIAAEGFGLRPGIDIEIADTPEAFAAACARLLGDPAARARIGASGRRHVLEKFGWDVIGKAAEKVLHEP